MKFKMEVDGQEDLFIIIVDVPRAQWKRRYAIAIETARKEKRKDFSYLSAQNVDLRGVDFNDCNLSNADFSNSDLTGASFFRANLSNSEFVKANLTGVDVRGADIRNLTLTGANLTDSNFPKTPIVPHLDASILQSLKGERNGLDMSKWHGYVCDSTHCRGGWSIVFAGKKALSLEKKVGPETTAGLVYWNSAGYIPEFYCTGTSAMKDMRLCAKRDPLPI